MSVINPRNRLVNFRLSEVEFEALRLACHTLGSRSISEFARSAVLEKMTLHEGGDGDSGRTRVYRLDNKVSELETRVGQLLSLVAATGASVEPEPAHAEVSIAARGGY